jgi:hypothetical protein
MGQVSLKVFVPRHESRAIDRVALAIRAHAPRRVALVDEADADLVVIHVTGRLDHLQEKVADLNACGKDAVLIQYVLQSTQERDTQWWWPVWKQARLVWSYLNLPQIDFDQHQTDRAFRFYHAPLGCDATVFNADAIDLTTPYQHLVVTHGPSSLCEGVRECARAAARVGGTVYHLGPRLGRLPALEPHENIPDAELVQAYQNAAYVCGLRRIEGFELGCVEGLFCGARPILFDTVGYKQWYGSLAEYVPEGTRQEVEEALVDLWSRPRRVLTRGEISLARQRFHWPVIASGFWERVVN